MLWCGKQQRHFVSEAGLLLNEEVINISPRHTATVELTEAARIKTPSAAPRKLRKHEFLLDLDGSSALPLSLPLSPSVDKDVIRDGVPRIVNAHKKEKQCCSAN
jgi:hypothetical protein